MATFDFDWFDQIDASVRRHYERRVLREAQEGFLFPLPPVSYLVWRVCGYPLLLFVAIITAPLWLPLLASTRLFQAIHRRLDQSRDASDAAERNAEPATRAGTVDPEPAGGHPQADEKAVSAVTAALEQSYADAYERIYGSKRHGSKGGGA